MELAKIRPLTDEDISNSIRSLIGESSYLKTKVFKSLINGESLKSDIPKEYKNFISNYIRTWEDYANQLSEKIRNAEGATGVSSVNYTYAKEYIYSHDDYASVLQFADGVIKGISSGKFEDDEDIQDFFKFTANKAFHDKGCSVASILDNVLTNGIGVDITDSTTTHDASLFNACRKYKMFKDTDASELTKSVERTLDFIVNELDDHIRNLKFNKTRLFIATVSNIIEYITLSVTAYATRIYLISRYAYPHIMNIKKYEKTESMNESVDMNTSERFIHVMHDASELICRDYTKIKDFIDILGSFANAIGSDPLFGPDKPVNNYYRFREYFKPENIIVGKLLGNPLFDYITRDDARHSGYYGTSSSNEMNMILKEYIYNGNQSLNSTSSPLQEILHIIRSVSYENTVSGYQKLVKDVYVVAAVLFSELFDMISSGERWMKGNITSSSEVNTTTINYVAENIKMLKELYTTLSTAFLYKARDIEMHFNELKDSQLTKIQNDVSIKIPHQKANDLSSKDNMMNAVPHTLRLPLDLMDLYELPIFESLEMYDDYLRSLPALANDDYLNEAFSISSIINAIFSKIKAVYSKFEKFILDKRFESARKWVVDNSDKVLSMDYNGKEIYALPYKSKITLPEGYKNLITKLNEFDEKVLENEDTKKAYVKSLYPSETIYNWFYGNETDKSGPEMYRNHILFYNLNETKKDVPAAVNYSGDALKKEVSEWIQTIRTAPDALNEFKRIEQDIESALNRVKSKIVAIENAEKQQAMNDKKEQPSEPPAVNQSGENNKEGNSGNETAEKIDVPDTNGEKNNETSKSGTDAFLLEIQTTIMRLWGSLTDIFIHCFLTEYKYIKDAYSKARNVSNQ